MLPIINSEVVYLEKSQQIGSIQLIGCSELEEVAVLDYFVLYSFVTHLNIIPKCCLF